MPSSFDYGLPVKTPIADDQVKEILVSLTNCLLGLSVIYPKVIGVDLLALAAAPANPTNGVLHFARVHAGSSDPYIIAELGNARQLETALSDRVKSWITPSGTSFATGGHLQGSTTTGTISAAALATSGNEKGHPYQRMSTSGGANATATVRSPQNWIIGSGATGTGGGIKFRGWAYLNDASYANTGAGTGVRMEVGMTTSITTDLGTDNGNSGQDIVAFTYANVNGGATNTTWQFTTSNATSKNTTDTGLAVTAGHVYEFELKIVAGGTTVYWQITDRTAGTVASGSTATDIPSQTAQMAFASGVLSVDASVRTLDSLGMFYEQDLS